MPRSLRSRTRARSGDNDEGVAASLPQAAAFSKHSEPAPSSDPQPSEARAVRIAEHDSYGESENTPSAAASRPRATGSKAKISNSAYDSRSARCYFSELPFEVLDRILGDDALNIRDHCVLACVNRTLREAYSNDDLWSPLLRGRPLPCVPYSGFNYWDVYEDLRPLFTIMTSKPRHPKLFELRKQEDIDTRRGASSPKRRAEGKTTELALVRLIGPKHQRALHIINTQCLKQKDAMSTWKLSRAQLSKLGYGTNPGRYRRGAVKLYAVAALEALALRLHANEVGNGVVGYEAFRKEAAERDRRREATRRANGTWHPKRTHLDQRRPPLAEPRTAKGRRGQRSSYF